MVGPVAKHIFFAGPETAGRRHPRFAPTFAASPLLDARIYRSTRDFNNRSNNKLFHRRSLAHLSLIIVIFNDRERTYLGSLGRRKRGEHYVYSAAFRANRVP
jgi:hypothetical protein